MIRRSTVYVDSSDKEKILKKCEETKEILDKYPYSNYSDNFVTTMMRVKEHFSDFHEWAGYLDTNEDAVHDYFHFCSECSKAHDNTCSGEDANRCEEIKKEMFKSILKEVGK